MRAETYSALVAELVDRGEIRQVQPDIYEDLGGHLWYYDSLDPILESYVNSLSATERSELADRLFARIYGSK